ncbi:MAG: hypothetical protein AAFQ79_11960 [Pseudomonadota bacterium]
MTLFSPIEDVEVRLKSLIASGDQPVRTTERAEKLLDRLKAPVRIALLGVAGAERTRILNALADLPEGEAAPSAIPMELRYGDHEDAEITLANGTALTEVGCFQPAMHPGAVFVSQRRPLASLKSLSLIDVAAEPTVADQRAAMNWVLPRTDIALWVSPTFSDTEMQIWANAPDDIKDHAYLVLTGGPDGPDPAFLNQHAERVRGLLKHEFHEVVSVGHRIGAEVPTLIGNGVAALQARIRSHADAGRRADADSALMFLNSLDRVRSRPVVASRPILPEPVKVAEEPSEVYDLYVAAFTYLRDRAGQLLATIRGGDDPDPLGVLTHCGQTLAGLSKILEDYDDEAPPSLATLAEMLSEAEELVILLELEDGETPKIDAVSLLLQLRREFEARLAA